MIEEHKKKCLYSPIEQVSGRVKVLPVFWKNAAQAYPMERMEEEVGHCGNRIICQFEEDIDTVAALIRKQ